MIKGQTKETADKIINFIGAYVLCCCEVEERFFRLGQRFNTNKCFRFTKSLVEMCFYYVDLLKDLGGKQGLYRVTWKN